MRLTKALSSWGFISEEKMDNNQVDILLWADLHPPQSSCVGVQCLGMWLYLEMGSSKKWIKMNSLGWALIQYGCCPYEKRLRHRHTHRDDHVRTCRKGPSTSQGERPQEEPALLTPQTWTFSLRECAKMHLCCLSCPVYGALAAITNYCLYN